MTTVWTGGVAIFCFLLDPGLLDGAVLPTVCQRRELDRGYDLEESVCWLPDVTKLYGLPEEKEFSECI